MPSLKTRVPWGWLAVSCLAALMLAGCWFLFNLKQPEVSVADIQIRKTDGLAIDVSLLIKNPNGVGLDIQNGTGDLSMNGKPLARATANSFRLEPYKSTVVPVEIRSSKMDVTSALIGILQGKPATLEGALTVNVPYWGPVKVPFSSTGSVRLSMRGNYELEGTLTVHVPWWGPVKWPFSSTNKGDHL